MKDLQIIKGVECYVDDKGVVQLNLEHVARGLGFVDNSKGKEYVRWNTVRAYLDGFGFSQDVAKGTFIPEPIFYLLAMKADNQTAREFQRVVAYDILPAIRKHGLYAIDELLQNPDVLIEVATKLKEERQRRKLAEAEKEKLQIELDYSKEWYSIKRVAAINGISWRKLDWHKLKQASKQVGFDVRKVFDANYGEVNVYHLKAWEIAYPWCEL